MKKKILFVITKSNFGGAQRYVYELATGLPSSDFEVTVAFGGSGLLKEKLESAGIKTREIKSFARDINVFKEVRAMFELARIIREVQPDVVHLNSSKAGGTGAFVSRILGVPNIIFTAHGWAFQELRNIFWRVLVWFFSWLTALLAHKIILVSEYDFNHTKMPFVQYKLSVIHTAVPDIDFKTREDARTALFSSEQIRSHENDFWLITIAELTKNKNVESAVRAVAEFNAKNEQKIFYTVIGEGELRSELETYVHMHSLEKYICLRGYVDSARAYLKAFDAFLLSSYKEGMPYAVLEAGRAGIPVIASRVGGIPEIIEDGVSGILVDPNDVGTITHALEKLVIHSELQASFSDALRTMIEASFRLDTMLDSTKALYTDLHK